VSEQVLYLYTKQVGSSGIVVGIDFQLPHVLIPAQAVTLCMWEMAGLNFGCDMDYVD
jgi:hypothetical protein